MMKYLLSLVLIVGLVGIVGCGDGASSLDGNAAQKKSPPQSDAQPNPETDAQHNSEIDDKPEDKKSNPATSAAAGTGLCPLKYSPLNCLDTVQETVELCDR
jgi:hypothetical protein